jgi:hypothetical protein
MTKDQEIADLKQSLAWAQQQKTLRDEFAMAALQGLLISSHLSIEENCCLAYMYADAMMKERHK